MSTVTGVVVVHILCVYICVYSVVVGTYFADFDDFRHNSGALADGGGHQDGGGDPHADVVESGDHLEDVDGLVLELGLTPGLV